MNVQFDPEKAGEAVSWEAPSMVSYSVLKSALAAAGLSDDMVRDLAPRNAFSRAVKELSDKRVIRKTRESENHLHFQFTKEYLDENLKEYEYTKECEILVHKDTGHVWTPSLRDENDALAKRAAALIKLHMSIRLKRDVTSLVQRIFKSQESLLVRMRADGGMYFVPARYASIADQVAGFLEAVGGKLHRFTIYIGDLKTETAVATIMADHFKESIDDLYSSINQLSEESGSRVLANRLEKIQNQRALLTANRVLLGANLEQIDSALVEAERLMLHKLCAASA